MSTTVFAKNSFKIVWKQPLSKDSWWDEFHTYQDLYLDWWETKELVIMNAEKWDKKIHVKIPPKTKTIIEKWAKNASKIEAPREIEFDSNEIKLPKWLKNIHWVFHVWDQDESLVFERNWKPFPVEISYESNSLKKIPSWKKVSIYSSQDWLHREFHSEAVVIHREGKWSISFETTHMTYFYVGSILWDFFINNDDTTTSIDMVTLQMDISWATEMRFWNTQLERDLAVREPYSSSKSRTLSLWEWVKTVYAQFRNWIDTIDVLDEIVRDSNSATGASEIPFTWWLTLRYDSSLASSVTSSGIWVSEWKDQSWNAYDALQPNVSWNQPDYVLDPWIWENVLSFNWDDDYLAIETLQYGNTTALDWILVCSVFKTDYNASTSYSSNWAFLDYDRSEFFNMYIEWDWDIWLSYTSSAWWITDNSWNWTYNDWDRHIACASFDWNIWNDTVITADGVVIFDQDRVPNGTVLSDATTRFGFIGEWSEAWWFNAWRNNIYYDWSIAELVYFEGAKTVAERQEVECYLSEKRWINIPWCVPDIIAPIATVEYSIETDTHWYVLATLTNSSENIIITNNWWSSTFVFDANWSFTFEFQDSAWNTWSSIATVWWITQIPPISNEAPEIVSDWWWNTASIIALSWATSLTTISARDNMHHVVWEFWKSILTWSWSTTIAHAEICDPVTVASHRQLVTWETARAPRVVSKSNTWFDIKVDNYNSTLGAFEITPLDYIVFQSGSYNFNGTQVEAWSENVSTVACNWWWSYTWPTVIFDTSFSTNPAVLHTISSNDDPSWVVSHVNWDGNRDTEPTPTQMQLALHRSFNSCTHWAEDIDYVAFEQWHISMPWGFVMDTTISTDSIECCNAWWYPISYDTTFSMTPETILVAQLWEDWWNWWYWVIDEWTAPSSSQVFVTVDEDWPWADRSHTAEPFAAVSFSEGDWLFFEDNEFVYSLSWDDSSLFVISTDWELSFITWKSPDTPEDLDWNNSYEVTVQVCDSHCNSQCDTQDISVVLWWDICIETPSTWLALWPFEVSTNETVLVEQLSWHFTVEDTKWLWIWRYTTLHIAWFTWSIYWDDLWSWVFERKSDSVDLLWWSVNTGVVLDNSRSSFSTVTGVTTFLKRDSGVNSWIFWTYWSLLDLRITLPPYTRPDTYSTEIVYTLYEN